MFVKPQGDTQSVMVRNVDCDYNLFVYKSTSPGHL